MITQPEKIAVGVVAATILLVYAAAGGFLLRAIWNRWLREGSKPLARGLRWLRNCAWVLATVGLGCLAWSFYEPYCPEATHTVVTSPKLAGLGEKSIRIVHLSDLHCDATLRAEPAVIELVRGMKPDLIVFTGDSVNSAAGANNFRTTLTTLAKIAPTYMARGNWDYYFPGCEPWEGTGATLLDGKSVKLTLHGATIQLGGAGYNQAAEIDHAIGALTQTRSRFSLLLYHHPHIAHHAASKGVDLMLIGHTHGGQVCLPFYGAIVTLSGEGKRFEAGRYQLGPRGAMTLYINRGIGMEGGRAPRIRFLCRPEVALIELRAKPKP